MATMLKVLTLATLASSTLAATTVVNVGQNGAFTFNPDTIQAQAGDTLEFHFFALNHSVVMGDFANPCQPASSGGFFSGFFPVSSGESDSVFSVTINDTTPMAFYCSQNLPLGSHCKIGMAGVVNPSGDSTLDAYKSAAANVQVGASPDSVFGGTVSASGSSSSSSPPATSSSSSSGGGGIYGGGGPVATSGFSGLAASLVAAISAALGAFLLV